MKNKKPIKEIHQTSEDWNPEETQESFERKLRRGKRE